MCDDFSRGVCAGTTALIIALRRSRDSKGRERTARQRIAEVRRCILCQFLVSGLREVKMVMRFQVESGRGNDIYTL